MYKCMEWVLKGDTKDKFTQQTKSVGCRTVANCASVMTTIAVHIFPALVYQDQEQYIYR